MNERRITSDACVAEGAAWLAAREPRFADALALVGPLPLRLKPEGFGELQRAIVGQQVSLASAAAIQSRLDAAGMQDPAVVRSATDEELRELGLSRQKARYIKALAVADIDYDSLADLPTDAVIKRLTAVSGIGRWTAEIYAKFALGRADAFAAGDLALQEGAKLIFGLEERPNEPELRAMAEDWSPWRSVAARILWAYYKHAKQREGIR